MQELIDQLVNFLKGIWLKKYLIVISVWVICPIGWFLVWQMPDNYESEAKVHVDTQSLLRPLLRGLTIQPDTDSQLRLMVKTLMTRPNLEKISRMADLDVKAMNDEDYERILNKLRDNLSIGAAGRENLFTIKYETDSPEEAKTVVQSALNVFIENTLGESRNEADTAGQFIERQIKEYEKRLLEDERRLTEYKQKYSGILGVNVSSYYSSLSAQKSRLEETKLKLREIDSRLQSARAQLKGEEPTFGLIQQRSKTTNISTQYDGRIALLRSQLDELSLKYTDRHPNIIELNRRIEELETQREKEIRDIESQSSHYDIAAESIDTNPVYQQMKLNVTRLENERVSLRVRVNDYQAKVNEVQEKIHLIPEIESELVSLNRGYEITKSKYNQLLSRREQARLSQSADLTADDIQFKVVDPPILPKHPSGPNRVLFLSIVTILGLGLGIGLAFLASQVQPVLVSANQLTRMTGFPVFGSVAIANIRQVQKKERLSLLVFCLSILLALVVYGVLIALQLPI
ncbi:MAG: chain length determinant family protein [Proteobacteria bacterium]|nr:MAG: chain length determinant family protein [Pseudomonadota bacterium]